MKTLIKILIVLAIIVAAGYLLLTKTTYLDFAKTWPVVRLCCVNDETAGWKIYTNEKYGVEAKYPPGWIILQQEDAEFSFVSFADEKELKAREGKQYGELRCQAVIGFYNNQKGLSLYDWAVEKWGNPEERELGKISEAKINNLGAIKYEFMSMGMQTNILFSKNNRIVNVQTTLDGCDNLPEIFNQMLSTFKFTK